MAVNPEYILPTAWVKDPPDWVLAGCPRVGLRGEGDQEPQPHYRWGQVDGFLKANY